MNRGMPYDEWVRQGRPIDEPTPPAPVAHQTPPALRQAAAAMTATLDTPKRPAAPQMSAQAAQQETARLRAELEQERAAHARELKAAADERAYIAKHGMGRAARERLMEATPLGRQVLRAERAQERR